MHGLLSLHRHHIIYPLFLQGWVLYEWYLCLDICKCPQCIPSMDYCHFTVITSSIPTGMSPLWMIHLSVWINVPSASHPWIIVNSPSSHHLSIIPLGMSPLWMINLSVWINVDVPTASHPWIIVSLPSSHHLFEKR